MAEEDCEEKRRREGGPSRRAASLSHRASIGSLISTGNCDHIPTESAVKTLFPFLLFPRFFVLFSFFHHVICGTSEKEKEEKKKKNGGE